MLLAHEPTDTIPPRILVSSIEKLVAVPETEYNMDILRLGFFSSRELFILS